MTKEQALALARARVRVQANGKAQSDTQQFQNQIKDDLTGDMSFGGQVAAGAGRYMTNLIRGAGQMVGAGPSGEEVAEQRRLDAPLAATPGGRTGEATAALTLLAPTALIPGANSLTGAGALGAAMSMLQPSESTEERLMSGAVGFGAGAAGQKIANMIGGSRVPQATPRNELLDEATKAGYVVPPATAKPNFVNNVLESLGGKVATAQQASVKNQNIRNAAAIKALGLPKGASLTDDVLNQVRANAGRPYAELADISPQAKTDLEALKQTRFDMNDFRKFYAKSGDPSARTKAQALSGEAKKLEEALEASALQAGKPDLVQAMRQARPLIAKSHAVGNSLDPVGNVSGRDLAKAISRGDGELGLAARFAGSFPKANQDVANIGSPGVSALMPWAGAALGVGGYGMGGPEGALLGALPFARYGVRSALLSKPYQSMVNNPPNTRLLAEALKKGLPPAAIAAPSLLQGQQ